MAYRRPTVAERNRLEARIEELEHDIKYVEISELRRTTKFATDFAQRADETLMRHATDGEIAELLQLRKRVARFEVERSVDNDAVAGVRRAVALLQPEGRRDIA